MLSVSDTAPGLDAPRRRNGRLQACEPCRQRKVACDHKQPVCSRCKRGNLEQNCIYLRQSHGPPGPPRPMASPAPPPRVQSYNAAAETGTGQFSSSTSQHQHQHQQQQQQQRWRRPQSPSPLTTSPPDENVGFLGVTSYEAVIQEAQNVLPRIQPSPLSIIGDDHDQSSSSLSSSHDNSNSNTNINKEFRINKKTRDMAIQILRTIPEREACHKLFNITFNPNEAWSELAARWLLDSLWATFGKFLDRDRTDESLEQMALILCRNSSKTLREDYADPGEWFRSFSGEQLRWEAVGILFGYFTLGVLSSRSHGGNVLPASETGSYATRYMDSTWDCIDITRNMSCANTLLLYLMYKHSCLDTIINGENSFQAYRLAGENVCLCLYLGLHTSPVNVHDRSVSTQIKRRLFNKLFHGDKVVASFSGRPPLLSRKFVSTPLPLDIADEVLLGITPWRDDLVDENGWNTLGKIYATTIMRARASMGFIRDAILEIALQPNEGGSRDAILDLRQRELDLFAQFPACVRYTVQDLSSQTVSGIDLYSKLLIQLEHLQNIFLIERLVNKSQPTQSQGLLQVSLDIISVTMVFWTHQNLVAGFQHDCEWLVMGFAGPAAGILCLELVQTQNRSRTSSSGGGKCLVSRSTMIQNLSLLAGFLNWMRPLVGDRKICSSLETVVQHVLDHTLDAPVAASGGGGGGEEAVPVAQMADWGMEYAKMTTNEAWDGWNLDLLDTFDWLRSDIDTLSSTVN